MYQYLNEVNTTLYALKNTYHLSESTLGFYTTRVIKFFETYMGRPENENRPQNTITYFDVNTYLVELECSTAEKVNCFQSLKRYFDFTYMANKTLEIMSHVQKPIHVTPTPKYIGNEHYKTLSDFIIGQENELGDRLLIGLFLFTGLSRNYIVQLTNSQFDYQYGLYCLKLWKGEVEYSIPLKAQLQLIVDAQVRDANANGQLLTKVFDIDCNYMSTRVSDLTHRIVGKRYTPTEFSNTFIKKCLEHGNRVWEVSTLTLESVASIQKHVLTREDLFMQQSAIVNSF